MATYRYCCVPLCTSTTIKTPEKIFFNMPLDPVHRKKWCSAMKRELVSAKSRVYVCEDHFDLENDMQNYMRYKLQGGRAFIKNDVMPHIFHCQKPVKAPAPSTERSLKRKRKQIVEDLLNASESAPSSSTSVSLSVPPPTVDRDSNSDDEDAATLRKDKKIKNRKSLAKRLRKCFAGDQKGSSSLVEVKEEYTNLMDDGNESKSEEQSNPQWLLFETVNNFINSQGNQLSNLFWTLPCRRSYPDYYNEVKHPICLYIIKTKIDQCQYPSLAKVVADMNLMFKYVKMYNSANSKVYKAAVQLQEVMQAKAKELPNTCMKWNQPSIPHKIDYEKRDQMQERDTPTYTYMLSRPSTGSIHMSTVEPNINLRHECLWNNCDHMFENQSDLIDHLAMEPNGHIRQTFKNKDSEEFELQCLWYSCPRKKKYVLPIPFPTIPHLIRHVKEVHLKMFQKNNLHEQQNRCTLSPTTKVIGMEDPSTEGTCSKSENPLLDIPQLASIKQELILPDDEMSPAVINSSSEPTRVEMTFCIKQEKSSTESESVPSDTCSAMDITKSNTATPVVFVHTQTSLQQPIRKLYKKYSSIQTTSTSTDSDTPVGHLQPHSKRQIAVQMRELPNYPSRLLIRQRKLLPKTSLKRQLGVQPVRDQVPPVTESQQAVKNLVQVSFGSQSQISVNGLSQFFVIGPSQAHTIVQSHAPLTDIPQVASIKQELILPDDETSPSFINSSSKPIRFRMMLGTNQNENTANSGSVPSDTYTAMDVTQSITKTLDAFDNTHTSLECSSGQFSSSTTMDMTTTCGIGPTEALPVDLNLVKKEIDEETLCH